MVALTTLLLSGDTLVRGKLPITVDIPFGRAPPELEPTSARDSPEGTTTGDKFIGPPEEEITVSPAMTAKEAQALALADLTTAVPPAIRPYTHYISIPNGKPEAMKVTSLALNYASRASAIIRPAPIANGYLIRVDLQKYAGTLYSLTEWLRFWEEFRFDPSFARLITRDTIRFLEDDFDFPYHWREEIRWLDHPGGRLVCPEDDKSRETGERPSWELPQGRYDVKLYWKVYDIDVIRFDSPNLDPNVFAQLKKLTNSEAPVVEHRYFKSRLLSTIKFANRNNPQDNEQVFNKVFGGLYYEFRGIRHVRDVLGNNTRATDLDLFFESLGIGNIRAKLTTERLFETLRSDQRIAIFRSNVTGKPREVDMFHVPSDKEGGSWGAITKDIKDENVDIGDRVYANLLNLQPQALEALFPTVTSLQIAALFNGNGELQDEVPFNVANDSTIPNPYTKRLQPIISCLRCHAGDGSNGWKDLTNDVKKMLNARKGLDIAGDLSAGNYYLNRTIYSPTIGLFDFDTLDRLAGLYAGDFSTNIRRAKEDTMTAILKCTGPWQDGGDQTDIAKLAVNYLTGEYAEYNYDLIDAQVALRECGIDCSSKTLAQEIFNQLIVPDPSSDIGGFILEDPIVGALHAGIPVMRTDFALRESFIATRALARRDALLTKYATVKQETKK